MSKTLLNLFIAIAQQLEYLPLKLAGVNPKAATSILTSFAGYCS